MKQGRGREWEKFPMPAGNNLAVEISTPMGKGKSKRRRKEEEERG